MIPDREITPDARAGAALFSNPFELRHDLHWGQACSLVPSSRNSVSCLSFFSTIVSHVIAMERAPAETSPTDGQADQPMLPESNPIGRNKRNKRPFTTGLFQNQENMVDVDQEADGSTGKECFPMTSLRRKRHRNRNLSRLVTKSGVSNITNGTEGGHSGNRHHGTTFVGLFTMVQTKSNSGLKEAGTKFHFLVQISLSMRNGVGRGWSSLQVFTSPG